ncbi:MAG TPA: hypothetical protein VEB22_05375 [Phycisphaerales bacterium]|nr:hypothetical protein [Phycisphaerales bacterium]
MALDLQALTDANAPAERRERAFAELSRLVQVFVRARMGASVRAGGGGRESIDICQSVAKSFVHDAGRGRLAFENEAALMAYLKTVVRTKLAEAKRRDDARVKAQGGSMVMETSDGSKGGSTPSVDVATGQAIDAAWEGLSDGDRELVRLRRAGMEWGVIAAQLGQSEVALRKRWSRLQARAEE